MEGRKEATNEGLKQGNKEVRKEERCFVGKHYTVVSDTASSWRDTITVFF